MSTKAALEALFPQTRLAVLTQLASADADGVHLRELARRCGLDASGVLRELRNLREVELVEDERRGRRVAWRLNAQHQLYAELYKLVTSVQQPGPIAQALAEALEPLAPRIELAYVFGSLAGGGAGPHSDIDLLVAGDVTLRELAAALTRAGKRLERDINPRLLKPEDYARRLREGHSFIREIHSGPRIMLIGDADGTG